MIFRVPTTGTIEINKCMSFKQCTNWFSIFLVFCGYNNL